jgi:guanylate kinase
MMTKPDRGVLFVVTGPSGAGKSTIFNSVLPQLEAVTFSVSATTRAPRPGEVHGKDYFFLDRERFEAQMAQSKFLEWAEVFGNYYGTPSDPVDEALENGISILLDLDPQGATQIAEKRRDAVFIFISPPDAESLETRLRGRGTEDPVTLGKRLGEARNCINIAGRFDYFVVNDDLEATKDIFKAILIAETYRTTNRTKQVQDTKNCFNRS